LSRLILFGAALRMSRTLRSPRHGALRALLKEERKAAGLTQTQLANRLKRPQSFIAEVENGQRRLSVVEFMDYAEAIGFDAARAIRRLSKDDN
jgi:transcriptional regulator with XRE-family HTH domain